MGIFDPIKKIFKTDDTQPTLSPDVDITTKDSNTDINNQPDTNTVVSATTTSQPTVVADDDNNNTIIAKVEPDNTHHDDAAQTTDDTDATHDDSTVPTDNTVDTHKDDTPATDIDTIPDVKDEEVEPVIDVNAPQVRLTTSIQNEKGYIAGFSIQGRSHIMNETNCQDYHAYEELAPGWHLAITSDGAGSAREAERGSKANCELTTRLVRQLIESKKWIEKNYFPTELEWYVEIRNIFELIQAIIQGSASKQATSYTETKQKELADAEEALKKATSDAKKSKLIKRINTLKADVQKPLEARDFNATIVLMLITPQGMLTAHIGDGRMGYLDADGNWKALMTPHKGDEASATVFIPNNWNAQREVPAFTMSGVFLPEVKVVKELPKAFVLMSDGCESITWRYYAQDKETGRYYDPNEPFAGFFNPLLDEMNEAADAETRVNRLIEIINMGTTAGRQEQDDRTMIFGVFK